ncbi:MAG: GNAT family N-acetyltransferase [Methylococcaceae bacterium]|nr:GNAT family N-acetyltransferase [Methylococcaceae bacterium]
MGQKVSLVTFTEYYISPEYIGWLNDKVVMRYSNQRFYEHTLESSRRYLASFEAADNLFLAIVFEGVLVGTMTAYISKSHQVADLGILLSPQVWGQGFGLDAWQTLMNYLLSLGIRKITGGTLRCNTAMLSIMQRSGMIPDGVRRAQEMIEGQPMDILYFAKFNAERNV